MLGEAWLFITALLVIVAIILKQPALFIIAILFFLTSGLARLWSKNSLKRLEYQKRLSTKTAFFGDQITLETTITNRKFLPLSWVMIQEEIPKGVTFLKGRISASHINNRANLSSFISLGWYHRLTRRYPVQCTKRGLFLFGPTTISAGDPFGFFRNKMNLDSQERLLVYPRILPLEELGIPSRHPFGDLRIKRHIFEDPVQVMTTREYVSSDPMKYISWKATARLQRLQSRVFEHTTTMDMALFLDTRSVADANYWSTLSPDFLETGVLTATSIAANSFKEGYKVGLYVNEYYYYSEHLMKLPPSNNPDQLKEILEALAQVQGLPSITAENLLIREARQMHWETTIVMITAVPTLSLTATLKRLQRAGRRVAVVVIGSQTQPEGLGGIMLYRVSEEVHRRNLESLRLGKT